MTDIPTLIDTIITNPEQFGRDTQAWLETNAVMLGSVAVGALAVSGAAGFGWSAIAKWAARRRDDRRRFGGLAEARRANLMRNTKLKFSGIPIGRIGRKRVCWIDQEPVLVTGGTRSGKGVGVIRPACLTYGGPLVAYDGGKGELYRDTAGYRAMFSHVMNFDLTNPDGVHFNFLDEIDPANPVAGADNIAKSVPKPANADGHFEPAADRLMAAVILHVVYGEPDAKKNMAEVTRLISQGDLGMQHIAKSAAHSVAVDRVNGLFGGDVFGENADDGMKYRQSVYNSALVRLSAFEDPIVAKVTSRSDFRMRDLFRLSPKKRPVSLYLTTPASEDDRLKPVVSMFLALFMSSVMREQPALDGEPRTLLVIDEFASLRMEIIQTAITKIVGAGCTMLLGAQSLNALSQSPYGPQNQFRDNIRCHVAYAANDATTQRDISQSCGTVSERRTSTSKSRQTGTWAGSRSETQSETEVPAMNAGEVRQMPDHEELIIITGQPVIKATKLRDYKDRILRKRLNLPPPPMRSASGTYPDLPHPARASTWAGISVKPVEFLQPASPEDDEPADDALPPEPAKAKPKPKSKRKLIAATGDDE
jgi:type IV secretion system protein VirD4